MCHVYNKESKRQKVKCDEKTAKIATSLKSTNLKAVNEVAGRKKKCMILNIINFSLFCQKKWNWQSFVSSIGLEMLINGSWQFFYQFNRLCPK